MCVRRAERFLQGQQRLGGLMYPRAWIWTPPWGCPWPWHWLQGTGPWKGGHLRKGPGLNARPRASSGGSGGGGGGDSLQAAHSLGHRGTDSCPHPGTARPWGSKASCQPEMHWTDRSPWTLSGCCLSPLCPGGRHQHAASDQRTRCWVGAGASVCQATQGHFVGPPLSICPPTPPVGLRLPGSQG